jgi:hypothetical protein
MKTYLVIFAGITSFYCNIALSEESKISDDGGIKFGISIPVSEKLTGGKESESDDPLARQDIDKIVENKEVKLEFDSGRLCGITFKDKYDFSKRASVFKNEWKNLPYFDDMPIKNGMKIEVFKKILDRWEETLIKNEHKKQQCGDLKEDEFSINRDEDEFMNSYHVNMGPSRRTKAGGLWCDSWHFNFSNKLLKHPLGENRLVEVSAFCDEYNTNGRTNKDNAKK